MRCLNDEGSYCHQIMSAAAERMQEQFGSSEEPAFESRRAQDHRWLVKNVKAKAEATFLGSLAMWCAEAGIQLRGGEGLRGARHTRLILI